MEPSEKKKIEDFINNGDFREALFRILNQIEKIESEIADIRGRLRKHENDVDYAHKI